MKFLKAMGDSFFIENCRISEIYLLHLKWHKIRSNNNCFHVKLLNLAHEENFWFIEEKSATNVTKLRSIIYIALSHLSHPLPPCCHRVSFHYYFICPPLCSHLFSFLPLVFFIWHFLILLYPWDFSFRNSFPVSLVYEFR